MNLPLMNDPLATIREQFAQARQAGRARHREIAEGLHISEGELIAAHTGVQVGAEATALMRATRLQPRWADVLTALTSVGEVMALTRNASCVHEKDGSYAAVTDAVAIADTINHAQDAIVRGTHIDLHCHFTQWQHGFAVEESGEKGVQRSLQFYDATGTAVHKVFCRPQSDLSAYLALVEQFAHTDQQPGIVVQPLSTAEHVTDFAAFLAAWDAVNDARDLHKLLAQSRGAALPYLQQMRAESVQAVPVNAARTLLENAATEAVSVLILVGNAGVTQAHQGAVDKVVVMGPWLNVLDPGFNLHLREDHIASAWVVVQSSVQGMFSALTLLDQSGALIALFAADGEPGKPETGAWAALIDRLQKA